MIPENFFFNQNISREQSVPVLRPPRQMFHVLNVMRFSELAMKRFIRAKQRNTL